MTVDITKRYKQTIGTKNWPGSAVCVGTAAPSVVHNPAIHSMKHTTLAFFPKSHNNVIIPCKSCKT